MGLFRDKPLRTFMGGGDVFFVLLRNAMNVFWQKKYEGYFHGKKRPKNINNKRMSKIRPNVCRLFVFNPLSYRVLRVFLYQTGGGGEGVTEKSLRTYVGVSEKT